MHKSLIRTAAAAAVFAVAIPLSSDARSPEIDEPLKLAVINSSDFDSITYVYGTVLQRAGFEVEYVNADYTASWTGIQQGDLHVSVCWDTTWDVCAEGLENGSVLNLGSSGVEIREGWWYPDYVEAVCPGLPNWEALLEESCIEALSTVEVAPKARFVAAPAGWVTWVDEMIEAFELPVEPMTTGSPAALVATFKGAVDRKENIIGWGYVPQFYFEQTPGAFIEFPAYEPECRSDVSWGINPEKLHDCDLATGYIWKFMNADIYRKAPYAARIFHLLELDTATVSEMMHKIDEQGVPVEQVAEEWVNSNEDVWSVWLR
jgi:glycine betaine/proline transport system substrate-binding protein